jgi:tripartite-type tricarboxylate transporter receptor subunit TctC
VRPGRHARPLVQQINATCRRRYRARKPRSAHDAGIELAPGSADQFSSFVKAEVVKWAKVIKEAGISAD